MIKTMHLSLIALVLLMGGGGVAQAQDAPIDRTIGEQASGPAVAKLNITIGGVPRELSFQQNEIGQAIYQGDIVVGPIAALQGADGLSLQDLSDDILFGLAIRNRETRWPEGNVRYRISLGLSGPARVRSAIAEWEAKTAITFTEIEGTDGNYVEFVPGAGCSSAIGMVGGRQEVTLGASCSIGNAIHEIGHVLGLHHEQARGDRGQKIVVLYDNIEPGYEANFDPDPTNFADINEYCYGSIMHYGAFAFSTQPGIKKTIVTVPNDEPIGQRSGLAPCDVETIRTIYGANQDAVAGSFEGDVELFPADCRADGKCYLRNDLLFTDPSGMVWKAGKRIEGEPETVETGVTDGASIPDWAQPIIGEPFNAEYLKAAIVHDHYCYKENHVRTWRQTHRMFFDALQALGVPALKAKVMYAAVYLGGPKWVKLVPGENCGPNCIFDAITGNEAIVRRDDEVLLVRPKTYDEPGFDVDLAEVEASITSDPDISLTDIEALIQQLRPDDMFYQDAGLHAVSGADDPILTSN